MRVYVWGKRELFVFLLVLVAAALLFYSVCYLFSQGSQETIAEPFYQGVGEEKCVSLTINVDWGEEYLPDILQVLAENKVSATFFLTGRWTSNNPELAKSIAEAGHEIGNHAYSHTSPNSLTVDGNREEIRQTAEAIEKATGVQPKLYAPPSGERDPQVLQAAEAEGCTTILWSVDTIDWQRPQPSVIYDRVMQKIHPGAIILAHPTASTLEALPQIIQDLQAEGYRFVCVSENIGLQAAEGRN